jgi:hypothetical protein
MIIITRVGKGRERRYGYWTYGPPGPTGGEPAASLELRSLYDDACDFLFSTREYPYKFTISGGKNLNYTYANTKGQTGAAIFIPLWTLVEAQQAAKP